MRDRIQGLVRRVVGLELPEMSPVAWVVLLFMGAILGDGVRARAARSPIPADDANLIALLVIVSFVALVVVVASVVHALRDD